MAHKTTRVSFNPVPKHRIKIIPTIATDALENLDDLYDGFYEVNSGNLPNANGKSASAEGAVEERQRRLVDSIAALNAEIEKASTINFTKLLSASILEEDKRRVDAMAQQIAQAEKVRSEKKRQIEVAVFFLSVSEIDTLKETFAADVLISTRWREEALDNWSEAKLKGIDFDFFFNPNLFVDNLVLEWRTTITNNIFRNKHGETYMTEKTSIRGVFSFSSSLKAFPFDVQDLRIALTSEMGADLIEIVPSEEELSMLMFRSHVDQLSQTWHLHEHIHMQKKEIRSEFTGANKDRSCLEIIVRSSRNTKFYWYNVYAMTIFILQLASLTFVIDPFIDQASGTPISARLHLCLMVFLNVISFKISVSLSLPKISYMTCVDKYIVFNILMLVTITLNYGMQAKVVAMGRSADDLRSIDRFVMISCIGFFVFWNLVYFTWLRFSVCKRRYLARQQDADWRKWRDKKLAWLTILKHQADL